MFKNKRTLQIQMVKTPKQEQEDYTPYEPNKTFDLEKIHNMIEEDLTKVAVGAILLYSAKVTIDTLSKVAILKAKI